MYFKAYKHLKSFTIRVAESDKKAVVDVSNKPPPALHNSRFLAVKITVFGIRIPIFLTREITNL